MFSYVSFTQVADEKETVSTPYEVERRYSDFVTLRSQLVTECPGVIVYDIRFSF